VSVNLKSEKKPAGADAVIAELANQQAALTTAINRLAPVAHRGTYDQFDEDGDNVHSGVYENMGWGEKSTNASTRAVTSIKRTMLPTRVVSSWRPTVADRAQLQVRQR